AAHLGYLRKYGLDRLIRVLNDDNPFPTKGGQAWIAMTRRRPLSIAEIRRLKIQYLSKFIPRLIFYSNTALAGLAALRPALADERKRRRGHLGAAAFPVAVRLLSDWISWHWKAAKNNRAAISGSLRKVVKEQFSGLATDTPEMGPLREGR